MVFQMVKITKPEYIDVEIEPTYIYFKKYPDIMIEHYKAKRVGKIDDINSLIDELEKTGTPHINIHSYNVDFLPRNYTILGFRKNGKDYIVISSDGKTGIIYEVEDYSNFISKLASITISGDCICTTKILNPEHDYYEMVLPDGSIATSEDEEFKETLHKILHDCKEIKVSDI